MEFGDNLEIEFQLPLAREIRSTLGNVLDIMPEIGGSADDGFSGWQESGVGYQDSQVDSQDASGLIPLALHSPDVIVVHREALQEILAACVEDLEVLERRRSEIREGIHQLDTHILVLDREIAILSEAMQIVEGRNETVVISAEEILPNDSTFLAGMPRTQAIEVVLAQAKSQPLHRNNILQLLQAQGNQGSLDDVSAALAYLKRTGRARNPARGLWSAQTLADEPAPTCNYHSPSDNIIMPETETPNRASPIEQLNEVLNGLANEYSDKPLDLEAITKLQQVRQFTLQALEAAILQSRLNGATWAEIGGAVGCSHQNAFNRWRHLERANSATQLL